MWVLVKSFILYISTPRTDIWHFHMFAFYLMKCIHWILYFLSKRLVTPDTDKEYDDDANLYTAHTWNIPITLNLFLFISCTPIFLFVGVVKKHDHIITGPFFISVLTHTRGSWSFSCYPTFHGVNMWRRSRECHCNICLLTTHSGRLCIC